MTRITLAVLDLAGTTAREDGIVEQSVREAVDIVTDGHAPADLPQRFHAMRGGSKLDMLRHILENDPERAYRAHEIFEERLVSKIRNGKVEPLPGAEATFEALRARGIRTALITGFSGAVRDLLIETLHWRNRVDLVLSPEDAGRGRPHPDLIWAAALRLEASSASEIAVVGDTTNDLLAGTRAGAGIVAGVLTGAHPRTQLEVTPHTHIFDTVADLTDHID